MSGREPRTSAWDDPRFRRRVGRGLMTIGICFVVNVATTPGIPWWWICAVAIAGSLVFEHAEARQRLRTGSPAVRPEASPAVSPAAAENAHLAEVARLSKAVEDLAARLSDSQRELLGDVGTPVASLEERVRVLVRQAAEVDAELRLHDEASLEREARDARARVEALPEGAQRVEEQGTLDVLEQQLETLRRVRAHRSRIEARLRTAVGMMRSLHLDLVELLSTDLDGSSSGIQRIGDQVREVSRSVDALASALDEVYLDDVPPARRRTLARRSRER